MIQDATAISGGGSAGRVGEQINSMTRNNYQQEEVEMQINSMTTP